MKVICVGRWVFGSTQFIHALGWAALKVGPLEIAGGVAGTVGSTVDSVVGAVVDATVDSVVGTASADVP
jgi:hypothetical protein